MSGCFVVVASQARVEGREIACDGRGAGGCVPRIARVTSVGELVVVNEARVK